MLMSLTEARTFTLDADLADVFARLEVWAQRHRQTLHTSAEQQRVYRRGGGFLSWFSFDIRNLPTETTIQLTGTDPLTVRCLMETRSWLHVTTPGDQERLSELIDWLVLYIKGVLE
jgi:hypothetical protein